MLQIKPHSYVPLTMRTMKIANWHYIKKRHARISPSLAVRSAEDNGSIGNELTITCSNLMSNSAIPFGILS